MKSYLNGILTGVLFTILAFILIGANKNRSNEILKLIIEDRNSSIFLVCIGVLNTVLMSVLERTREFGVLIAIGSRPNDIFKMIFIETILLATLSMLFGLILVVPLLIFLTQIGFALPEPIDMGGVQFHDLRGSVSVTVLLVPALIIYGFASLVTIIPGLRASSITPKVAMSSH